MFKTVLKTKAISSWRYKSNFISGIINGFLGVIIVVILLPIINEEKIGKIIGNYNYFGLTIMALFLYTLASVNLWSPTNNLSNDLASGELEYLYVSDVSMFRYLLYGAVFDSIIVTIAFSPLLVIVLFLADGDNTLNGLVVTTGIILISSIIFAIFGFAFSSFTMRYRQATNLVAIFSLLLNFITGVYFPIELLWSPLRAISYLLPLTYAIDIIRYYYLGTIPFLNISIEWLILFLQGVVYFFIAKLFFNSSEKKILEEGFETI